MAASAPKKDDGLKEEVEEEMTEEERRRRKLEGEHSSKSVDDVDTEAVMVEAEENTKR